MVMSHHVKVTDWNTIVAFESHRCFFSFTAPVRRQALALRLLGHSPEYLRSLQRVKMKKAKRY